MLFEERGERLPGHLLCDIGQEDEVRVAVVHFGAGIAQQRSTLQPLKCLLGSEAPPSIRLKKLTLIHEIGAGAASVVGSLRGKPARVREKLTGGVTSRSGEGRNEVSYGGFELDGPLIDEAQHKDAVVKIFERLAMRKPDRAVIGVAGSRKSVPTASTCTGSPPRLQANAAPGVETAP